MFRDRQRAILDAATRMFSQHGIRRASVDLIAEQARVAKPTIYAYFRNKDALFAAVCADVGEQILSAARASADTTASLVDRVNAVLAAKFTVVFELVQSSPYAEELLHPTSSAARENIAAADAAFRRVLVDLLAKSARSRELDLRAIGLSTVELAGQLLQAGYGAAYGANTTDEQRRNLRALVATMLRAGVPTARARRARPKARRQ